MIPSKKNEHTRKQIQTWLQRAVEEAQSPDPREQMKRQRQKKKEKKMQRYGL